MGLAVARGDFEQRHASRRSSARRSTCTTTATATRTASRSITRATQAIDSGAYDAYETPHWYNYYIRTIAHNTIVIHDPAEKFISRGKEYANDGGQRFINEPHFQPTKFEDICSDAFRDGRILAYREGDGLSYVCGDASNCYRKEKLTRFLRHVTFVLDWPQRRVRFDGGAR